MHRSAVGSLVRGSPGSATEMPARGRIVFKTCFTHGPGLAAIASSILDRPLALPRSPSPASGPSSSPSLSMLPPDSSGSSSETTALTRDRKSLRKVQQTDTFLRSDTIWHRDGNLVISARSSKRRTDVRLFKVHKSVLEGLSTVWRDLLSLDQPTSEPTHVHEGDLMIEFHDAAEDVEAFLEIAYGKR